MNPPIAFSPLLVHIPHAVPVVIIWGIMLRFYLVQRRLNRAGRTAAVSAPRDDGVVAEVAGSPAADRPARRRFRVVDDAAGLSAAVGGPEAPVSAGRRPTPGLE
jgi:hypothetical protein